MDPVSALKHAVAVAEQVRVLLAAFKNEKDECRGLVPAARALMHTCQLYEDTLNALRPRVLAVAGGNLKEITAETKRSLDSLTAQFESDAKLLSKIQSEAKVIHSNAKNSSTLVNAFKVALFGRAERIKSLEDELLKRVQVITLILAKDTWKNSVDEKLLQEIGDTEGGLFWQTYMKNARTTPLRRFIEAVNGYLCGAFNFRPLSVDHLHPLLAHTLFTNNSDIDSLDATITVQMFAQWLQRYGPMKDVIYKAAAMSSPDGSAAVWFKKSITRDQATSLILKNAATTPSNVTSLLLVRYSSDPKQHFVVTCTAMGVSNVQNYVILNSSLGYHLQGDAADFCPTVLSCVQKKIVDRIIAPGSSLLLPVTHVEQWDEIFAKAAEMLPPSQYDDAAALNKAAAAAAAAVGRLVEVKSLLPSAPNPNGSVNGSEALKTALNDSISFSSPPPISAQPLSSPSGMYSSITVTAPAPAPAPMASAYSAPPAYAPGTVAAPNLAQSPNSSDSVNANVPLSLAVPVSASSAQTVSTVPNGSLECSSVFSVEHLVTEKHEKLVVGEFLLRKSMKYLAAAGKISPEKARMIVQQCGFHA